MTAGADQHVERVVLGSSMYRALAAVGRAVERAIRHSAAVHRGTNTRAAFGRLKRAERVALAGWLLGAAAITHGALVVVMPRSMAPSPLFAVPLLMGCGGLILIGLAPALSRAWTSWPQRHR